MNWSPTKRCLAGLIISVLLSCFAATSSVAQVNLKIGYSLGSLSAPTNNMIIQAYNTEKSMLFDDYTAFNDLGLVYGISLGLRYKLGISALELTWEGLGRSMSATGINRPAEPAAPVSFTEEFDYGFNHLMLTYETFFGKIGLGTSVGKNFVSIKEVTANGNDKDVLFGRESDNADQYVARFHVSINFYGSKTVALAIKPFVQIGLSNVDLSPFSSSLGLQSQNNDEGYFLYGLSFAFYNGRQ